MEHKDLIKTKMESDKNKDLQGKMLKFEEKTRYLEITELPKTVDELEKDVRKMEMNRSDRKEGIDIRKTIAHREDMKENNTDTWQPPMEFTSQTSPDELIRGLRVIFESIECMLRSPDYDKDLQDELSTACPNYMSVLLTAKRDLLRNDCGIVVAGETCAGKTTLINQLVGKKILAVNNLPSTGKITRIRNSEKFEIKCYSKDGSITKEEEVQDVKKLKHIVKQHTDLNTKQVDLTDIYYVDVHLPVSILKENVIIVDTPGIGDDENLNEVLLDFLPHAVSFVFVVNAKNAGGMRKNMLSKILKTIMDNREKMPCFDPREVMFLVNQWDAIKNVLPSSDEDDDGETVKEDQHTQTWNHIQRELSDIWGFINADNIFRISLEQVEKNEDTLLTDEYKRFEKVLKETINRNENKRVEFYYRFLKDFIRDAERGTLVRLKLLEKSEEEQHKIITQTDDRIQELEQKCKKSRMELEKNKAIIISMLTRKLYDYLHSSQERDQILNPPGERKIDYFLNRTIQKEEIITRIERGIRKWSESVEVQSMIEAEDANIRLLVKDIESQLLKIEIDMTGIDNKHVKGFHVLGFGIMLSVYVLILPFSILFALVFAFMCSPFYIVLDYYLGADGRRNRAYEVYDEILNNMSMSELEASFENSFGAEYSKVIVRIFDESFPKMIENLLDTNRRLRREHKAINLKQESLTRLKAKIKKIQESTENFENNW